MTLRLFELMLWAAGATVLVSAVSILLGLGLLVCAARVSSARRLSPPAAVFVGFFRGVPLLVQLLLIYNLLPGLGLYVPSVVAAPRHPRLEEFLETYLDRGAATPV